MNTWSKDELQRIAETDDLYQVAARQRAGRIVAEVFPKEVVRARAATVIVVPRHVAGTAQPAEVGT